MTTDNSARLQRVSELLAETRIAVYPVDARGKVVLRRRRRNDFEGGFFANRTL